MNPSEFGAQIRVRRLEQHLEIEELAKLIGTTRQHLADMEAGNFFKFDDDWIEAIDVELNHSPHDCLMFDGIKDWLPAESGLNRQQDEQRKQDRQQEFVDFSLPRDLACHTTFQC